mgnify:CR=1 FL=1
MPPEAARTSSGSGQVDHLRLGQLEVVAEGDGERLGMRPGVEGDLLTLQGQVHQHRKVIERTERRFRELAQAMPFNEQDFFVY